MRSRTTAGVRTTPNVLLGTAVGAGYLIIGAVCSAVALGSGMAGGTGPTAAHCAGYLTAGALLLLGVGLGRARSGNTLVGATYLTVGLGLLLLDAGPQLLALHHPDAVVHLGAAALLVGFGRTQE